MGVRVAAFAFFLGLGGCAAFREAVRQAFLTLRFGGLSRMTHMVALLGQRAPRLMFMASFGELNTGWRVFHSRRR